MRFKVLMAAAAMTMAFAGCATEGDPETQSERGAIGKADLFGSCSVDDCGGKSSDGNCWCDDLCDYYGDCCADEHVTCDCPQVMCALYCENGFAVGEDGCEICACKDAEPVVPTCGGFAGLACPPDLVCVDDPSDDCSIATGGADCSGICIDPPFCGGFGNIPCAGGLACVDDPRDDCHPSTGGADCSGVCLDCGFEAYCGAQCTGQPLPGLAPECGVPECDCPPMPDSCETNCGGQADDGSCWCDSLCTTYGDCCADYAGWCTDREVATGMCVKNSFDSCNTDADCIGGGCGGELCFNPAVSSGISTCECTTPTTTDGCGCVEGQCSWYIAN